MVVGGEDMKRLYWLVHNNEAWLHRQLDIRHSLPLAWPLADVAAFSLDTRPREDEPFNPIIVHQTIGSYKFDHVRMLPY